MKSSLQCFKDWFLEEAARHVSMRQALTPRQIADLAMAVGDIIHFGPKTVQDNVITPKYGVIREISGNSVTVLRFNDAKVVKIPKNQLYEVPYSVVNGRFPSGHAPAVAADLENYYNQGIIKRQQVWMKLTPKQLARYKKFLTGHDISAEKMNPDELMRILGLDDDDIGFESPDEPSAPTELPPTEPKNTTLFGQEIPKPPEVRSSSLSDRLKTLRKKPEEISATYSKPLSSLDQIRARRRKEPISVGEWVALNY